MRRDGIVPPNVRPVVTEGNYLHLPLPRWEAARAQLTEVWHVITGDATSRRSCHPQPSDGWVS